MLNMQVIAHVLRFIVISLIGYPILPRELESFSTEGEGVEKKEPFNFFRLDG
jgi:hypothetical protein